MTGITKFFWALQQKSEPGHREPCLGQGKHDMLFFLTARNFFSFNVYSKLLCQIVHSYLISKVM